MWERHYSVREQDFSIIKGKPDLRLQVKQVLIAESDADFKLSNEYYQVKVEEVTEMGNVLITDVHARHSTIADDLFMLACEKCVDWYDDRKQKEG